MQSKRGLSILMSDWATFNIRKIQRKGQFRQPEEQGLFTPDFQYEKNVEIQNYTSNFVCYSRP